MQYAMVIDTKSCLGCNACTIACKQANATGPGIFWNRVYARETGKYPDARLTFLPAMCMHCEDPPCVQVCPTHASHQLENGIVRIDKEKCIGCRVCMFACPYSARFFNDGYQKSYFPEAEATQYEIYRGKEHIKGTVQKCDFCCERVEAGENPACVDVCPVSARIFGDADDPESETAKIIEEKRVLRLKKEIETSPSVYYLPDQDGGVVE